MLDVHLHGKMVFPFAAELEAREIPFLFATAGGARGIPGGISRPPVLQKPFGPVELRRALMELSRPVRVSKKSIAYRTTPAITDSASEMCKT